MTLRGSLLSIDGDRFDVGCGALGDGMLDRAWVEVFGGDGGADVEETVVDGKLGCERRENEEFGG